MIITVEDLAEELKKLEPTMELKTVIQRANPLNRSELHLHSIRRSSTLPNTAEIVYKD